MMREIKGARDNKRGEKRTDDKLKFVGRPKNTPSSARSSPSNSRARSVSRRSLLSQKKSRRDSVTATVARPALSGQNKCRSVLLAVSCGGRSLLPLPDKLPLVLRMDLR